MRPSRAKIKSKDPVIAKRWAYGWPCKVEGKYYIIPDDAEICETVPGYRFIDAIAGMVEVVPETVSQQTGLKDSKGVEIYEGDIMRRNWDFKTPRGTHRFGDEVGIVEFCEETASWLYCKEEGGLNPAGCDGLWETLERSRGIGGGCKIIGNIHNTPKLMEQDNE